MAVKGNAKTHSSKTNGHKASRQRFAIKSTGLIRGAPLKSKRVSPWYLKSWGSKPVTLAPETLEQVV